MIFPMVSYEPSLIMPCCTRVCNITAKFSLVSTPVCISSWMVSSSLELIVLSFRAWCITIITSRAINETKGRIRK